jgi:hypothetical protein
MHSSRESRKPSNRESSRFAASSAATRLSAASTRRSTCSKRQHRRRDNQPRDTPSAAHDDDDDDGQLSSLAHAPPEAQGRATRFESSLMKPGDSARQAPAAPSGRRHPPVLHPHVRHCPPQRLAGASSPRARYPAPQCMTSSRCAICSMPRHSSARGIADSDTWPRSHCIRRTRLAPHAHTGKACTRIHYSHTPNEQQHTLPINATNHDRKGATPSAPMRDRFPSPQNFARKLVRGCFVRLRRLRLIVGCGYAGAA